MRKNKRFMVRTTAVLLAFGAVLIACGKADAQSSGGNAKTANLLASALDKARASDATEAVITAFAEAPKAASPSDIAGLNAKSSPGGDFSYDLNEEEDGIIIKKYTGNNRVLIFPAEIEGYPVVQIGTGDPVASRVQVVIIPENVRVIYGLAFAGRSNLHTVTFPASLTTIGQQAFEGVSLKSLDLSSCTNLTEISGYAFHQSTVESVDLSSCTSLKRLGDGNLGSVFSECKNLKTVKLPDSLEIIQKSSFWGCSALTDINIPSSIKEIGQEAFWSCSELYNLTIPDTLTKIAFKYEDQFEACGKLPIATRKRLQGLGYTARF